MEVLTDNVVVFCLNIIKEMEMSKLKRPHKVAFLIII